MKKIILFFCTVLYTLTSFGQSTNDDGIYATLHTTKGDVTFSLFYKEKPVNTANFINLAQGKKDKSLLPQYQKQKLYDGTVFRRQIEGYMIASRNKYVDDNTNPIGTTMPSEHNDSLSHIANILCLTSNSGENDGSQMLIIFKQLPFSSQASVSIGVIVDGLDIAKSLRKDDVVNSVSITKVGKEAKAFKPTKVIAAALKEIENAKEIYKNTEHTRAKADLTQLLSHEDRAYQWFAKEKLDVFKNGTTLLSGVIIKKTKETNGALAKKGQYIWVGYTGYLPDGRVFDSSYDTSGTTRFTFGSGESIAAWDEVFEHIRLGEKATIIVPSSSAYGGEGGGRIISPYSTIIFELYLEKIEEAK